MIKLTSTWQHLNNIASHPYKCGYCDTEIASDKGYFSTGSNQASFIWICHVCNRPTFIEFLNNSFNGQFPGSWYGDDVDSLPNKELANLYSEARACISVNAFTASVLCSRKLIMNIAHSKGATEGLHFIQYVEYLDENHYIPPDGKQWVDHIRQKGNEATHEIEKMSEDDAKELIDFIYMLMKFIYEFPARIRNKSQTDE